jgi:hypothetical protein
LIYDNNLRANLVGLWPIIQNDFNLKRGSENPQGLQLKLNKNQMRATKTATIKPGIRSHGQY